MKSLILSFYLFIYYFKTFIKNMSYNNNEVSMECSTMYGETESSQVCKYCRPTESSSAIYPRVTAIVHAAGRKGAPRLPNIMFMNYGTIADDYFHNGVNFTTYDRDNDRSS